MKKAMLLAALSSTAAALAQGMSHEEARQKSLEIGLLCGVLSVAVPVGLWLLVMRPWKPTSRWVWALKFALWPGLLFSFNIGRALGQEMSGVHPQYQMDIGRTFEAWFGCLIITAPIFWLIGYAVAPARFRAPVPAQPADATGRPSSPAPPDR